MISNVVIITNHPEDFTQVYTFDNHPIFTKRKIAKDDICVTQIGLNVGICGGLKWKGHRPTLIIINETEDTLKFKDWILRWIIPCGSKDCRFVYKGQDISREELAKDILKEGMN